jgi:hypothetical protein
VWFSVPITVPVRHEQWTLKPVQDRPVFSKATLSICVIEDWPLILAILT